ncbi:MAG: hypothetical protein M5U28_52755 [Sandaracinaceae bacterium]|nr:hypothetical protein [Sandaracinaceae bacterium]
MALSPPDAAVLGWHRSPARTTTRSRSAEADFDPLLESARPQFVYYAHQGARPHAERPLLLAASRPRCHDQPIGGWTDGVLSFTVATDRVTGNIMDYQVPATTPWAKDLLTHPLLPIQLF